MSDETFTIRPVRPEEYSTLGQLILDSYNALPGRVPEPEYDVQLLDVGGRVADGVDVLVVVNAANEVVGGVTYVGDPSSPYMEIDDPDAASFRHMAVAVAAQGHGLGALMVEWVIASARRDGRRRIRMHSGEWMHGAHRLYERMGFVRLPHIRHINDEVRLYEYLLELQ